MNFLNNLRPAVLLIVLIILLFTVITAAFLFTPLRKHIVKKYQLVILLAATSMLIELLISPLRGYIMSVDALVGFFAYLLASWYLIKRYNGNLTAGQIAMSLVVGLLILGGPHIILNFTETRISFPDFLIHLLGIFGGYFLYNYKNIVHKVNLSVSVLIVMFTYFYGYNLWMNNISYGTFTSEVHYKGPAKITLLDKNANNFTVSKGKVTVLDFWFVGCGACMNDFPEFQKLYTSYKNNTGIQFLSVNQPYPRDKEIDRFKYLTDAGFSFPMAAAPDTGLITNLQISVYPTVIILDEDGDVIFKGSLKDATSKIKALF